ncbi:MAG TPA: hypothetical protein QF772_12780 [Nitrospinaceae bacterium]|nr:hypothetical protein [Nitrospinaceae bacterium]
MNRCNVRWDGSAYSPASPWCSMNSSGVMIDSSPMPAFTVPGSLEGVDGFDRVSVVTCNEVKYRC